MKNKKIILFIIVFLLSSFFGKIQAEETIPVVPEPINIHLTITTPTNSLYDQDINVTPCDSSNPSSQDFKITAYCAVLQSSVTSDWNFSWAPGIFLNSINNIAGFTSKDNDGNDVYHYWSWSLNGTEAQVGLNQYELQANDLISLTFVDPTPPAPEPEIVPISHGGGGGMLIKKPIIKTSFDSKKAFDFLISKQKEDGSWGIDIYTDWVALAIGPTKDYEEQKTKLIKYFKEIKTTDYQLTDYERHAMAIMALGINPFNVNGENYIEKITNEFDTMQFGDKEKVNDDIFALIILHNAGFTQDEEIIKNAIKFILSKQQENGSWDNSVDMTSASIQSIISITEKNCFLLGSLSGLASPALTLDSSVCESPQNKEFSSVIYKAKEFLKQNQKDDGGFGNISSTAWAIQGILSLGEKPIDWVKNGNSPLDYLVINQDSEGNIKNENMENKIWETAYVLSALSDKTWNQIMQKFDKPIVEKKIVIEKKEEIKPEIKKVVNKIKKANLTKEITATPINVISDNQTIEPIQKQNWFKRFINKIFNF